jgi:hypothetical protein
MRGNPYVPIYREVEGKSSNAHAAGLHFRQFLLTKLYHPGRKIRTRATFAIWFMTFLNPLLLIGLAAAAIPVILHLLNLRKLRTIEFSSLQFLKELQKTRIRRLRIRQWLLLLLRTLLVISLVLAFARPALHSSLAGFVGTRASTTMIVLVDDSPSMSVRNETGELFVVARKVATSVLSIARQGDQVYVLPLSALRRGQPFPPPPTNTGSGDALAAMEVSFVTVPFPEAIRAGEQIAGTSSNANKELYLITDGQATQFRTPSLHRDSTVSHDDRLKVFLVTMPHRSPENTGVTSLELRSQIIARNKPALLRAEIRNFGSTLPQSTVASAYLNGTRVAQQTAMSSPGATVSADFVLIPKTSGILDGYVQLEEDAFDIDNRRYFVLDVPDTINVLLVGSVAEGTKLASVALLPGTDSSLASLFHVRSTIETQLASVDFAAEDVVVLCGVRDLSDVEAERIIQFIRAGGGVMVFPGPSSDISNYNAIFFARLGIPAAVAPEESAKDTLRADGTGLSFDRIDFAHPILAGLFDRSGLRKKSTPAVESPHVRRSVGLSAGPRGRTIISLSNGRGFLVEHEAGEGHLLLCAVDAGLEWSDFAVKGLFAPLLNRSALYLSAATKPTRSFAAGEAVEFHAQLRKMTGDESFTVKSPSGIEERVVPQRSMGSNLALFTLPSSHEPGVYDLRRTEPHRGGSNERIAAAAVNIDEAESDLRIASPEEVDSLRATCGITTERFHLLSAAEPFLRKIEESRYGVELWRYFLGIALLLALAEMAVGRAPTREPSAHSPGDVR